MVLCFDENSQIQALDRTQPQLATVLGYVEGCTQRNPRRGAVALFAAQAIFSGKGIAWCKALHRREAFVLYLRWSDKEVPADPDAHLVLDNHLTHKHSMAKRWLASGQASQMPRTQLDAA